MTQRDLDTLRRDIDAIDKALISLLAKRFQVVDRVIAIKHASGAPAAIPERIEEVIANAANLAREQGLPVQSIEKLWRLLVAETIAYEEQRLGA